MCHVRWESLVRKFIAQQIYVLLSRIPATVDGSASKQGFQSSQELGPQIWCDLGMLVQVALDRNCSGETVERASCLLRQFAEWQESEARCGQDISSASVSSTLPHPKST